MNPQSAAIAGSGNLLKSRFEFETWAKIFSKSADSFAYSPFPCNSRIEDQVLPQVVYNRLRGWTSRRSLVV